jgi:pilus assembly protein CpaE
MTDNAEDRTIRVLIVDDIAETRENIRKLLQFEADIDVVGAARSGAEGIELAKTTKPDVVLMDINMPDMDGITATEGLIRDVPYAQIVILSVQSEIDYVRRAMLAGARDFLAKPPSADELTATIRLVAGRAQEIREKLDEQAQIQVAAAKLPGTGFLGPHRMEGKLLTVYSAKGGVGCTTLATNLAIGLNTGETPTVLVDGNMQFGDVSVFLNLQSKFSIVDLAARREEIDPEVVEDVLRQHESGLRVLAAPSRPEMADEIQADQVREVLHYLRRHFAYVVVDTSSTIDDVTLAVLDATDLLIAIATPDIPAIKDSRLLFDLLHVLDFPVENVFFVLNKMDRKSGITPEAVSENLKREVEGIIPADERTVTVSINKGVPLLLSDKTKSPARDILQVMGAIKQRLVSQDDTEEVEEVEPERSGMFGR